MLVHFQKHITSTQLFNHTEPILVAVSGGVDSVVLAHLLYLSKQPFAIAHCNFLLRGEESDKDQLFVQSLAEKYQVPFFTIAFDTKQYVADHKVSIQVAARDLRYQWLEYIRNENHYHFIATAHHQNDVAETMLYNLTKGTGIAGLHGIRSRNGKVIRPLLFATKLEIAAYAAQEDIAFREDASNDETKYARNKIRHQVVPALEAINPQFIKTMGENAQRFQEMELIYKKGLENYKKQLIKREKATKDIFISIVKLKKLPAPATLLFEIIRDFGYSNHQVQGILNSLEKGEPGKLFYSSTHQILLDRKFLIVMEQEAIDNEVGMIVEGQKKLKREGLVMEINEFEAANYNIQKSADYACLDAAKIAFPLKLRRWKQGDYFYPFGMGRKKQKVSKYFINQKMKRTDKRKVWILEDNEQRILWVVGYRTDDRFRITDNTEKIIELKYQVS